MIKKTIATAAILGVGAIALFGSDACSYSRTLFGNVREAVRAEIDPEFELDHIRNQVGSLMPEIRQHMKVVATQVVDVRNMQVAVAEKQSELASQKASILALRSDLDSGQDEFRYRRVSYSRHEVEADLADRFSAYQLLEDSLDREIKILTATKDTLKANQKKLDAMLSRKESQGVKVAQAEARLKVLQAEETVHQIEVDDTQLSHVEDLLAQLNHDLDVREAMMETEGHPLFGRIPVEEPEIPTTSVIFDIDQHFGLTTDAEDSAELASAEEL